MSKKKINSGKFNRDKLLRNLTDRFNLTDY